MVLLKVVALMVAAYGLGFLFMCWAKTFPYRADRD